jgi:hypothetical protein
VKCAVNVCTGMIENASRLGEIVVFKFGGLRGRLGIESWRLEELNYFSGNDVIASAALLGGFEFRDAVL